MGANNPELHALAKLCENGIPKPVILRLGEESSMILAYGRRVGFFGGPQNDSFEIDGWFPPERPSKN